MNDETHSRNLGAGRDASICTTHTDKPHCQSDGFGCFDSPRQVINVQTVQTDPGGPPNAYSAGYAGGSIVFQAPSSSCVFGTEYGLGNVTADTPTDATFAVAVQVPQYCPTGTYSISLILYDSLGNSTPYTAAQLQSMGFPSAIAVSSGPPSIAQPTLTSLSVSPMALNVSAAPGTINVQTAQTDPGGPPNAYSAGYAGGSIVFQAPSSSCVFGTEYGLNNVTAGTRLMRHLPSRYRCRSTVRQVHTRSP